MIIERPERMEARRIFGLDLSKKTFTGCMLDLVDPRPRPPVFDGRMTGDGWLKLCGRLGKDDYVVMEGGTSSAYMARFLERHSEAKVFLLNPCKLHIIFESMNKTDRNDAIRIAKYLRDTNPESWCLIPITSEDEASMRSIVSSQIFMKETRTKLINKLHAIFNHNGVSYLKKSDLKEQSRRYELAYNLLPTEIAKSDATLVCGQIDSIEMACDSYEEMCRQILLFHPKEALAWLSLPGVGLLTASACVAYIGDGRRFSTASQIRNYVGLVPRIDQSGMKEHIYGVNHFGCMPVRRNIVQAAWAVGMIGTGNTLTEKWKGYVARGKKGQRAAVAIANDLVTIGWTLLKKQQLYNGFGDYEYLKRKLRQLKLMAIDSSMYEELK